MRERNQLFVDRKLNVRDGKSCWKIEVICENEEYIFSNRK
jgi:hypothetical protein